MATRLYTTNSPTLRSPKVARLSWALLTTTDQDGQAYEYNGLFKRSFQLIGTLGAGFSMAFQGSNDGGTTWATLRDEQGTLLTITAVGFYTVGTIAERVRPNVTAGDGSTSVSVIYLEATN